MNLNRVMRTGHVKRWHIVRVRREQTIAEHMYRVWAICRAIGQEMNLSVPRRVALEDMALLHDRSEVVLGDIPTPTKQSVPGLNHAIDAVEASVDEEWAKLKYHIQHTDPMLLDLLKLADLLEAISFLDEEAVSLHAQLHVKQGLIDQYKDLYQRMVGMYKGENLQKVINVYREARKGYN